MIFFLNENEKKDFNFFYSEIENELKKTVEKSEITNLINFESEIQKRLIGQDDAIRSVSGAIKRANVGLNLKKKPIGSFIFCGPTGVGKTEMAKTLARNLFKGNPKSLIRYDMSEYMDKHSVSKLLGTSPGYIGYDREGVLTQNIRENPKSVLLFDEIEKSDKQIMDLFLQVLDEGVLRDSKDNIISFTETIIILTSNIGAGFIFDFVKDKSSLTSSDKEVMNKKIMEQLLSRFRPEFINRLDEVVIFQPLVKEVISKILTKQLEDKKKLLEYNLNMSLILLDDVFSFLLLKGFNLSFGARQVSRVLQQYLETPLIDFISKNRNSNNNLSLIKAVVNTEQDKLDFVSDQ